MLANAYQESEKLERELADAATRIKDLQDGIAAANERWIADKRELADLKIKMSGNSREYEELLAEARMSFRNEPPDDCTIGSQCLHTGNCLGRCSLAARKT
jgi:septal ring factor EnvC (AmiA/AmiB activator)